MALSGASPAPLDLAAAEPSAVRARYARACTVLLALGGVSLLPAGAVAFALPRLPEVGPLRWLALFAPLALAGTLVVVASYFVARAEDRILVRPAPGRLAGGALLLFAVLSLVLTLPSVAYPRLPPAMLALLAPADAVRLDVLRRRAVSHPDLQARLSAARVIYLIRGEQTTLRGAEGRAVRFDPSVAEVRRRALRQWLVERPGTLPAERRLMAAAALLAVALVLAGVPLAAVAGARHRGLTN